jgi:hypothetical protein
MQYLLSEEEYRSLDARKAIRTQKEKDTLLAFCVLASQHIPVESNENKPWGCNLDDVRREGMSCDDCPAKHICPFEYEQYSK